MSATFEALKFLARLEAAGSLPALARQADDALADATGDEPATKAEVEALRSELREGLSALETDLRGQLQVLRVQTSAVKAEQLVMKWVLGFNFALIALLFFLLLKR